jgi:hypothetical protein
MIKYTLAKDKSDGFGGNIPDIKVVTNKSELKKCLKNNWYVVDKYTPILTPFKKWWNNFTTNQKIAILTIIIPLSFACLKWSVETYLNHEYHSLKIDYKSLNEKYYLLQEKCNDSITTLNERIETISLKLKNIVVSEKK